MQVSKERKGKERKGKERKGKERKGKEEQTFWVGLADTGCVVHHICRKGKAVRRDHILISQLIVGQVKGASGQVDTSTLNNGCHHGHVISLTGSLERRPHLRSPTVCGCRLPKLNGGHK